MLTLLIFLAVLSILVISHEYGHFITARKSGIKVEEFGFGFPPRLVGIQRLTSPAGIKRWRIVWGKGSADSTSDSTASTLYSFNIIPLGGFVKIKGESGGAPGATDPDSFTVKPAWQKALVLSAGVIMNVLVAVALFSIGFIVGVPQNLEDKSDVSNIPDHHIQIMSVLPLSPAAQAGLKAGDKVLVIDTITRPRLPELQSYVDAHKTTSVNLTIERAGVLLQETVQPVISPATGKGVIGIAIGEVGTVRYPWYRAIGEGVKTTGTVLRQIALGFYTLLRDLVVGRGAGNAVSGPIGVAVITGAVARLGFSHLIQFIAILSLNLAVLNILPIPALDGGRLLFVIFGVILRRPVKARVEELAHVIGFAALMLLVIVVTVKDIGTFGGPVLNWVKNIF